MQSHPPYYNPSGLILNSLSFIKFSFYVFILNPIFWIYILCALDVILFTKWTLAAQTVN